MQVVAKIGIVVQLPRILLVVQLAMEVMLVEISPMKLPQEVVVLHASTAAKKGNFLDLYNLNFELIAYRHNKAGCTASTKPRACFNCGQEGQV
jgi:hypothetical protein